MTKKIYTFEVLNESIQKDGATLIGEYPVINSSIQVSYICKCGIENKKSVYCIVKYNGAVCKKCSSKLRYDTFKTNNLKKYGVEHHSKLLEVKNKIINTNLEKYGVRSTLQLKEVKEKIIKTNLEKYGKIHPMQSNDMKEKISKKNLEKYGVKTILQLQEVKEKIIATNLEKYGNKYPLKSEEVKEKKIATNLKKYGVKSTLQIPEVRKKMIATNLEKYGVAYTTQSPEVKEKIIATNLEKYGVDCVLKSPKIRKKLSNTNLEKYGKENVFQSEIIKNKIIETNQEKYGVDYPQQNILIMEKTQDKSKKYKSFKMPSGEVRKVQGFEPFAIRDLLKLVSENSIKTNRGDVPRIKYIVGDKIRYHFPDIYLPEFNKIIEVKSKWTYKCKEDNIQLKKLAAEECGYIYEIWCYDVKGNRITL